ncbi:polyamine transporter tpo5 [Tilletia horrida]|uniref:Polyamine transporter tpo5 n=1 Tax=Tilletia horrida TaxID=155126 RepID=A0AAN6JR79_9BASI|nr:polyamine transporter tpo5 [Tilletia horrida]KAK0565874.1 polyamine transporter tpo5 [Tilletia horrida]
MSAAQPDAQSTKSATPSTPDAQVTVTRRHDPETGSTQLSSNDDDAELAARMGYKSEFAREFKSLSTISFAFSIMGLVSSVATTFNSPFTLGGPAPTVWTWFMGSIFNFALGVSIGELVSAFPSCGGLYSASGMVVPRKYRAVTAWFVGYLNFTGQLAGIAGTCYGLSQMIWAYVYVATNTSYVASTGATVGLYAALMAIFGLINCLGTKTLARLTSGYVFVNLGATLVLIIIVLARTPREEIHTAAYTFGEIQSISGWSGTAIPFLLSLLSVQFVMTDYDATAHISEEIHRAAYAAPAAIIIAVGGTGLVGWILNIVLVLVSGNILDVLAADPVNVPLTWPGGLVFAEILLQRGGRVAFLVLWPFICAVAAFVCITAIQANARSAYAMARDRALPSMFYKVDKRLGTTINATILVTVGCILLGLLAFASYYALTAIFALAALGMDLSYVVPIICRQIFQDHPEVQFKPGPFHLGRGWFGRVVNGIAIVWTLFECIVLCIPTTYPITARFFNYSWVIALGVLFLSGVWYVIYAHRVYEGPRAALTPEQLAKLGVVIEHQEKDSSVVGGRRPSVFLQDEAKKAGAFAKEEEDKKDV